MLALGSGNFLELLPRGLGGKQALVDHLFHHLAKNVGRGVQRLTLTDQALGDSLAFDVGHPHSLAVDRGSSLVAAFGRAVSATGPTARGQGHGQRQDDKEGSEPVGDRHEVPPFVKRLAGLPSHFHYEMQRLPPNDFRP